MMETDWATGAYGDTGVAEMDAVTGGLYSGGPGVDSLPRIMDLISSSYHTKNYTLHLRQLLISLALSARLCVSVKLRGSSHPGSIKPYHHLPTPLEHEPLFVTNSLGMP